MNPLELYLSRVARELRSMPFVKRDEELRELRSHLEQRAEDFEAQGLKVEEAQTRAVEGFGSPRALGAQLGDAWEGMPFSWWRVAAAICVVSVLWFAAQLALVFAGITLMLWPQSPLFPEIPGVWMLALTTLPVGCGALLALWLGRRGPILSISVFAFFWAFTMLFPKLIFIHGNTLTINGNSLPMYPLYLMLSFLGATGVHALRKRQLKLATNSCQNVFALVHPKQRLRLRFKRVWAWLGVFMILGLTFVRHVYLTLHPATPVATMRNSLLTDYAMNPFEFQVPTILAVRELPAKTLVERAGREQRVWFQVEARATKDYATRRIAFYQKQLASPLMRKLYSQRPLQLSLARMQRNNQIVQGVARLVKTRNGWQVDEKSFDRSKLWAWAEDIYFER